MKRQDKGMPFLLQYENVAWYENGVVRILDRRIFPKQKKFVCCKTYHEIIKAIQDMVTQSAGPYTAVGMGMALAAYECKDKTEEKQIAFLTKAAKELGNARPTTANRYSAITNRTLELQKEAIAKGQSPIEAAFDDTLASLNRRYSTMQKVGNYLVDLMPNNSTFLTQCYGETIIGAIIRRAKETNKNLRAYDAATEPFLQGSRLTASCFKEAGFDTTVVDDNMVNFVLERGDIDFYTSAADSIAMDGHIANKIGTKQIAVLAKRTEVPYFVTGIPDQDKLNGKAIEIEYRDPEQALEFNGQRIAMEGVNSLYPAFDVTPPTLIDAIVTDKGVFSPFNLKEYANLGKENFY